MCVICILTSTVTSILNFLDESYGWSGYVGRISRFGEDTDGTFRIHYYIMGDSNSSIKLFKFLILYVHIYFLYSILYIL